ncbi:MAG: SusC/RagA family TonB-linked outer membrane protein [Bacteroidota bacterium]
MTGKSKILPWIGSFCAVCLATFLFSPAANAQQFRLTARRVSLKNLFKQIETQTGYAILYQPETIKDLPDIDITIDIEGIKEIMEQALKNLPLDFVLIERTILIRRKAGITPAKIEPDELTAMGTVTDEAGKPLTGVTIKIQNGTSGGTTDLTGHFSLRFREKQGTLIFSFVGYTPQEVEIKGQKKILTIILKEDHQELSQVQVIAYGTTSKQLNPGNVTTVKAGTIAHASSTNVLEALQGRVPGLFIQQNSGQTGGDYLLKIRSSVNFVASGTGSNSNTPQPMILIDGVSIPVGGLPQLLSGASGVPTVFRGGNFLNYLNPDDIESIDVLKDADATAIYGSRGAYGVILITTKKAVNDVTKLQVNVSSGFAMDPILPHLLNTRDFIMLRKEALSNDGVAITAANEDVNGTWSADRNKNWPKIYEGNFAARTNAGISYNGGGDLTSFLISGNFRQRQNVELNKGGYHDGQLRFSVNTHTPDKRLAINMTGSFLSSKNDMLAFDITGNSALFLAPNAPDLLNADGSLNWNVSPTLQHYNPIAIVNTIYENKVQNLLSDLSLDFHPMDRLWVRSRLGYNQISSDELSATPSTALEPGPNVAQKTASIYNHYKIESVNLSTYAEYTQSVGQKGTLNLKAGGELNSRQTAVNDIYGSAFSSDAFLHNPGLGANGYADYNTINYRNIGFFGIAKLVWDDKYIVDLNARRDGSSRFSESNRFGTFGSVGAAWIISSEHFIQENAPWVSFAKLRSSYGIVGGDALADYAYLAVYNQAAGTYAGQTGLRNAILANPNLQWERNKRVDVGLELGFLKNRIYLETDYYQNHSTNELVNQPSSSVTGSTISPINTNAVIETSGWEFSLSSTNLQVRDFSWHSVFNMSIPHNKLLSLPNISLNIVNPTFMIGKPLTGILLYKYEGVNPQTGNYNFMNAAGQTGEHLTDLTSKDKTEFLDLAPKFFGGFQNTFKYRRFQLTVFLSFTKRTGQSYWSQQTGGYPGGSGNLTTDALRRWQKPGDMTDIPRASAAIPTLFSAYNFYQSTGAYTDASYIRLQQLSFSYDIKSNLLAKAGLKTLSVSIRGQNLLTFTGYKNGDPEQLNYSLLPTLRTITAGIDAGF